MSQRRKLCVLATHPIQYMAPWFRQLALQPSLQLEVLYLRELDAQRQGEGFGQAFHWDLPLREGYVSQVLQVASGVAVLPRVWALLWRALRRSQPDVLLITGWNEPALVLAYPLASLLGVPVLLRGESNALRTRGLLARCCHRLLLAFVDAVLVIGKSNRQFYLNNKVAGSRLFDGAYFVESERMVAMATAHAAERAALRARFGFGESDFVFAFSGKHTPFKRPMLLVEAAALLRQRGLAASLLFAGAGELTEALRDRAAQLGVPAGFTGFLNQTEIWQAFVPADAFVLPSTNRETWGLVTNEALLFGLPVLVSNEVGCGPDLVVEGETGFVFSGGAAELALVMERLLLNPARAQAFGAVGRKRVLEQYSMPVATAGLLQAVQALCP